MKTGTISLNLEATGLSRSLANTETLQIAEIHMMEAFRTPIEDRFERITRLGKKVLQAPVVGITAVSDGMQWFKSVTGWNVCEQPLEDSLCVRVVEKRELVIVPDLKADPDYADHRLVTGAPKFRFYAGVPLLNMKNDVVGTLCAMDVKPGDGGEAVQQSLLDLADLAQREMMTGVLHNAQASLVSKLSVARRQALLDPLTRTWNRRGGLLLIEQALDSARQDKRSVAVLAVDLDDFKHINDTHGHAAGDAALRMVARELLSCVRNNDGVCRFGGDEFFVVISGVSKADIDGIAVRLSQRIRERQIRTRSGETFDVSISIGSHWLAPDDRSSPDEILAGADRALYDNKLQKQLQVQVEL